MGRYNLKTIKMKMLTTAALLTLTLKAANGLRCYTCNSHFDPLCGDPFFDHLGEVPIFPMELRKDWWEGWGSGWLDTSGCYTHRTMGRMCACYSDNCNRGEIVGSRKHLLWLIVLFSGMI